MPETARRRLFEVVALLRANDLADSLAGRSHSSTDLGVRELGLTRQYDRFIEKLSRLGLRFASHLIVSLSNVKTMESVSLWILRH